MRNQSNSAAKLLDIIEKKDRRITELEQQNEWLLEQFRLLRRKQYGTSSEQIIADQVSIFNEAEASSDLATPEPSLTEVKTHYRKGKSRLTTDKLPEDLPVVIIEHSCPKMNAPAPNAAAIFMLWAKRREKKSSSSRPKQSLSVMSEMFTPVEIVRTRPTMFRS